MALMASRPTQRWKQVPVSCPMSRSIPIFFTRSSTLQNRCVKRDTFAPVTLFTSSLLWYPFHGKMQLGGEVIHFDVDLNAGVGVIDSPTSRGVTGVGGIGFKFFGGSAMAVRVDFRDLVYQQELLAEQYIVNDLSITAGLSIFLPLGF